MVADWQTLFLRQGDVSASLRVRELAMTTIQVTHRSGAVYDVVVDDGRGTTRHEVTVWPSDVTRYAPDASAEELIEASLAFLLEREPKEAILSRFELPVIERYFPGYPARIAGMIGR
jgi:hypothetical protein